MLPSVALGQLRHLYKLMLDGDVHDTAEAARGLLGPAIETFETCGLRCTTCGVPATAVEDGRSSCEQHRGTCCGDVASTDGFLDKNGEVVHRVAPCALPNGHEGKCRTLAGRTHSL